MSLLDQTVPLDALPQVLRWDDDAAVPDAVHDAWAASVQSRYEALAATVDPQTAARLAAAIEPLPPAATERVLHAPETTFRLFWRKADSDLEAAAFLERAARAEAVHAGLAEPEQRLGWTALGDMDAARGIASPVVPGLPPIDLDSPAACTIDLTGARYTVDVPREPYAGSARGVVLERVGRAAVELPATAPAAATLVRRFTKVLILQADETEQFSSGSNGQFVGRSVVANPHIHGVDAAVVADGVVHESIHGLLYMQELGRPWVLAEELYDTSPRTQSPWSGRSLPLRPFLQACFVWYGLLNFWARAATVETFADTSRRELLLRAATGFLGEPLVAQLDPYRHALRDEVVAAVADMQADVIGCFAGGV